MKVMKVALRYLVERLSRGKVFRRRLPTRFGAQSVYVSPDSMLSFWRHNLEAVTPELFRWADELVSRGSKVWDIGANVGLFSFAAACRAGRNGLVVACEPDPWLAAIIRRSIAGLPPDWASIVVVEKAFTSAPGTVELVIGGRGRASNFVRDYGGHSQVGKERGTLEVSTTTLDDCASSFGPPDLIKIDIEGAEAAALEGGTTLLGRSRPELLIEVAPPNTVAISSYLLPRGYRLFDAAAKPCWSREVAEPTWNTLASCLRTGTPAA